MCACSVFTHTHTNRERSEKQLIGMEEENISIFLKIESVAKEIVFFLKKVNEFNPHPQKCPNTKISEYQQKKRSKLVKTVGKKY